MDHSVIMFFLLYPSCVGGFPIMSPLDLIYRGHPDPVTSELYWLKWLCSRGITIAKFIMIWITQRNGLCRIRNFKMLIQDPLALNWERAQQAVNIIKETLEAALSAKSKNSDIKKIANHL